MTDLLKTRILGDIIKSLEFAKNEERTKIQGLSDTLKALSKCLENIIQSLQKSENISPELQSELNEHITRIIKPFENTSIGKEVNEISQRLSEFLNNISNSDNPTKLIDWQDVQGKVNGLSQPVYISLQEKKLGEYVGSRRALLSFLFIGTLTTVITHGLQAKTIDYLNNEIKKLEKDKKTEKDKKLEIIEEFPELTGENAFKMTSFLWTDNDPATSYEKSIYNNQVLHTPPIRLKKLVSEMTKERFDIKILPFSKGQESQDKTITEEILNQVNHNGDGDLDCAYSGLYYDTDQISLPLFFINAIPFGLTPQEQMAWLNHKTDDSRKQGLTYVQLVFRSKYAKIHTLPLACTGMQMGGWFKKKINTIEDFRGLKMRIPGLGKEILTKKFGVESPSECLSINALGECIKEGLKDIPGYKIKESLENGTLDAAEWIGPKEDMAFDIHELSDTINPLWYYYYPGWWEPSTTFNIHVNKNSWDNKLSPTYRAIFESACSRVIYETLARYNYENGQALNTLKTEYKNKIEVLPFNREILNASEKGTNEYFESLSMPKEVDQVFTEWKTFKKNIREWSKYEAYYTNWDNPA